MYVDEFGFNKDVAIRMGVDFDGSFPQMVMWKSDHTKLVFPHDLELNKDNIENWLFKYEKKIIVPEAHSTLIVEDKT